MPVSDIRTGIVLNAEPIDTSRELPRMTHQHEMLANNRHTAQHPRAKLGVAGLQLFQVKRIGAGLGVDGGEVRIVLVYD